MIDVPLCCGMDTTGAQVLDLLLSLGLLECGVSVQGSCFKVGLEGCNLLIACLHISLQLVHALLDAFVHSLGQQRSFVGTSWLG